MINRTEQEVIKNWKDDISEPLVSVCIIAYNQEKYIAEALDGILMQETDFLFEIVVDDDCSTDGTAEVIKKYAEKFPGIIEANLREKNVGGMTNFTESLQRAKGDYIAYCDGDDYWTDVNKLQIQVDFLEENPDYVISGHDAFIIDENEKRIQDSLLPEKYKKDFEAEDLILGNVWILTMSWVFRNVIPETFPFEQYKVVNGDSFMITWLGLHGKSKYHSEIKPACYRVHPGGIWSMLPQKETIDARLNTYYWMYRYYDRIGEKKYAQAHLERYNRLAISRNPRHKPSLSIVITGKDNLKYYSNFSHSKQLPFNLRLFFNSSDGLRPLHNAESLDDEKNKIEPLDDHIILPKSDYFVTLGEQEILTENDIVKFLEYKTGKQEENITSLKEIEVCQREVIDGRVSVIIPTYKRPKTLRNALESVVMQDYHDIEVIVVCDNGKDSEFNEETRQIVNSFKDSNSHSKVIFLEHSTNRYGSGARNTGILNSTGEYICFLDDDDIYLQGRLSKSVEILKTTKKTVGAVYCGYFGPKSEENDLSRYKTGDLSLMILLRDGLKHYLNTDTATYKREAILRINGFNESYNRHDDLELNLRFFEIYQVECVKECLVRLKPEPVEVDNKVYDFEMFELKRKFLNQFSPIIRRYGHTQEKLIYEANWADTKRHISDMDAFVSKISENPKEGLIHVLNHDKFVDSKVAQKKLTALQHTYKSDIEIAQKKIDTLTNRYNVIMESISHLIKQPLKAKPLQKISAYKSLTKTYFELRGSD